MTKKSIILDSFKDNFNIFFNNISFHDFFHRQSNTTLGDSRFTLVLYERSDPEKFVSHFFELIKKDKIPVILDELTPSPTDYILEIEQSHDPGLSNSDLAFITYTSGSSSKPKAVLFTWDAIIKSAKQTNSFYQIDESDHWAITLPMNHIGGLMILFRCILAKASVSFHHPSSFDKSVSADITIYSLVPAQLDRLIKVSDLLPSLKLVILGGSSSSRSILERALRANIPLSSSYGQTETCAQLSATPITRNIDELLSIGRAFPGNSFQIKDGKLLINSNRLALKYLDQDEFGHELLSQDNAYFDKESGLFYITGRSDDIFISGGENISIHKVQNSIRSHFGEDSYLTITDHDKFQNVSIAISPKTGHKNLKSYFDFRDELKELAPFEWPFLHFYSKKALSHTLKITKDTKNKVAKQLIKYFFLKEMGLNHLHIGNPLAHPIFIFHGFMGDLFEFNFLVDTKLCTDYHLVFIDLPGHGRSDISSHNIIEFSKTFSSHIEKSFTDRDNISFLGYSMGARVCIEISKTLNKLSKFILESGGLGLNEALASERINKDKNLFNKVQNHHELEQFFKKWYSMDLFKGLYNVDHESFKPGHGVLKKKTLTNIDGWQKAISNFSVAHQKTFEPKSSNHELYYIYGENDQKYKELKNHFKKSFEISNASHNTHQMNTEDFIAVLEEILL